MAEAFTIYYLSGKCALMLLQKELLIAVCSAALALFISVDDFQDLEVVTGNKATGFYRLLTMRIAV